MEWEGQADCTDRLMREKQCRQGEQGGVSDWAGSVLAERLHGMVADLPGP